MTFSSPHTSTPHFSTPRSNYSNFIPPSKPWTPASPTKLTHHSSAPRTVSNFIRPPRHFFRDATRRLVSEKEALRAFRSHVKSVERTLQSTINSSLSSTGSFNKRNHSAHTRSSSEPFFSVLNDYFVDEFLDHPYPPSSSSSSSSSASSTCSPFTSSLNARVPPAPPPPPLNHTSTPPDFFTSPKKGWNSKLYDLKHNLKKDGTIGVYKLTPMSKKSNLTATTPKTSSHSSFIPPCKLPSSTLSPLFVPPLQKDTLKEYFEEIEPLCPKPNSPIPDSLYTSGCFKVTVPFQFIPLCRPETDVPPVKVRISKTLSDQLQKTNFRPPLPKSRLDYDDSDTVALSNHLHKACYPNSFYSRTRSLGPKSISLQSHLNT